MGTTPMLHLTSPSRHNRPCGPYQWNTKIADLDYFEIVYMSIALEELSASDGRPIGGVYAYLYDCWRAATGPRTLEALLVDGWSSCIGERAEARHLVARARILIGLTADQGRLHVMGCLRRQYDYVMARTESIQCREWVGLD